MPKILKIKKHSKKMRNTEKKYLNLNLKTKPIGLENIKIVMINLKKN